MGMGTIMGYIGIRRIEVANLITISECIRKKMPVDAIRTRLIPRNSFEVAYV
jgi:vacuolar-type H+-ATPase subunit C/Vma6